MSKHPLLTRIPRLPLSLLTVVAVSTCGPSVFSQQPKPAAGERRVTFGLKGGVPLGEPHPNSDGFTQVDSQRWTLGPTVEFRLSRRFSLGVDALYQPYQYNWSRSAGGAVFRQQGDVSRWEFPVYVKYRILDPLAARGPGSRWQPFVSAGALGGVSHTSELTECSGGPQLCGGGGGGGSAARVTYERWGAGFVAGGGVEIPVERFRGLRFAPEIRYSHWTDSLLPLRSPDQVSILLGIRF